MLRKFLRIFKRNNKVSPMCAIEKQLRNGNPLTRCFNAQESDDVSVMSKVSMPLSTRMSKVSMRNISDAHSIHSSFTLVTGNKSIGDSLLSQTLDTGSNSSFGLNHVQYFDESENETLQCECNQLKIEVI